MEQNFDKLAADARDQVRIAILTGQPIDEKKLAENFPKKEKEEFFEDVNFYRNYGIIFFEWCRKNAI